MSNQPLVVDVWSDVVCPFCYLGAEQLQRAIDAFEHRDQVVVRLHAFELDPHAPAASDQSLDEMLSQKYGVSREQAAAMNERVAAQARALGLTWHLERARPTNTFDAHRLIAFAATQGRAAAMSIRLHRAYFSDGERLSDHDTLARLADEVGVADAETSWLDDDVAATVRRDEALAHELGITGVPAFVFDGAFVVSGAQGTEPLLGALRHAWAQRPTD